MINKVLVFGDSYMFGSELPCADPDIRPKVDRLFSGIQRDHTGAIPEKLWNPSYFVDFAELVGEIPDYNERCHRYCMGGYLANKLSVGYENHSIGGYSNDAIMAELMLRSDQLDGNTLVLVGITYPDRTTRLDVRSEYNYIKTYNNFQIGWSREHENFLELYMKYGDDTLTKFMHVRNHIAAIKSMLSDIPHVLIDPTNIYRQSPEIDGRLFTWPQTNLIEAQLSVRGEQIVLPKIVSKLQSYFDDNLFQFTLNHAMVDIESNNQSCRESLGHPNKLAHEIFVDRYLHPYLQEKGITT